MIAFKSRVVSFFIPPSFVFLYFIHREPRAPPSFSSFLPSRSRTSPCFFFLHADRLALVVGFGCRLRCRCNLHHHRRDHRMRPPPIALLLHRRQEEEAERRRRKTSEFQRRWSERWAAPPCSTASAPPLSVLLTTDISVAEHDDTLPASFTAPPPAPRLFTSTSTRLYWTSVIHSRLAPTSHT